MSCLSSEVYGILLTLCLDRLQRVLALYKSHTITTTRFRCSEKNWSHKVRTTEYNNMSIYEEVEIEDLDYDPMAQIYTYPCPCGDKFTISLEALWDGEDIATCPSCTLRIEIIYDEENLPPLSLRRDDEEDNDEQGEGESDGGNKKEVSESEQRGETKEEELDVDISTIGMKSLVVR